MPWDQDFTTNIDVQAHAVLEQFTRAIQERNLAVNGDGWRWPPHCRVYYEGTIGALSDLGGGVNQMTDSAVPEGAWIINDTEHTDAQRWVSWTEEDVTYNAQDYDVVLNCDDRDIDKQVQRPITLNTATALQFTSAQDWVTAGYIPSLAWLVGKKYVIVKRNGLWWGTRWPIPPNDRELYRGDGEARTLIRVTGPPLDPFTGKTLHRAGHDDVEIEASTADTIIVPRLDPVPSGTFEVKDGATVLYSGTVGTVLDGLRLSFRGTPFRVLSAKVDGQDLLAYSAAGLQRIVLGPQTTTYLEFTRQDDAVSGAISIVRSGKKAWPGRLPTAPFQWYSGADRDYWTHKAGDLIYQPTLSTTRMAVSEVYWEEGDGITCENVRHPGTGTALDRDLWSAIDEECSESDRCYSPWLFRSFRQRQVDVLNLAGSFVPKKNYDGADSIETFRPATLFEYAGINFSARFTATADIDGNYAFTVSGLPDGVTDYWWAVLDWRGRNKADGFGTASAFTGGIAGKEYTLVVATGFTRKLPREFRTAYERSAFIPDIQTDDLGNQSVVDPPTQDYPGQWITRDPAIGYKRYNEYGFAEDTGPLFESGVRARYVGDNWGDTAIQPQNPAVGEPLAMLYWRNFWEGKFRGDSIGAYDAMKQGGASWGGRRWLRAEGKNWFGAPIGQTPGLTESITATGGSSTTITLAARWFTPEATDENPTPDPERDPFWEDDRYVGMMLTVGATVNDQDDVPQSIEYRTPITNVVRAGETVTVTFVAVPAFTMPATDTRAAIDVPALGISAGATATIAVPSHRRNWWRARTLTITKPATETDAEQTATLPITHNDDKVLWWADAIDFDIDDTCSFSIEELAIGSVYEWDGSKWIPPTDNTKKLPLSHLDPAHDTLCGLIHAGDYIGRHVFRELYLAINALVWTRVTGTWRRYRDPDDAEAVAATIFMKGYNGAVGVYYHEGKPVEELGLNTVSTYEEAVAIMSQHSYLDADRVITFYPPGTNDVGASVNPQKYGGAMGRRFADYTYDETGDSIPDLRLYGDASANATCSFSYLVVDGIPTGLNCQVSTFISAAIPIDAAHTVEEGYLDYEITDSDGVSFYHDQTHIGFDAMGDNVALNKYKPFESYSLPAAPIGGSQWVSSQQFGEPEIIDLLQANPKPSITDHGSGTYTTEISRTLGGYRVVDQVAVVKWNVAGGFEYVDESGGGGAAAAALLGIEDGLPETLIFGLGL